MKKYLPLCLVLALTGCKVDLSTTVDLADVLSEQHKATTADLNFEVAACNNYEDSRKESDSLIRMKAKVPTIFDGAEYVECYAQKFQSFAHFRVPVDVGALTENVKLAVPGADIFITSKKEDGLIAAVYLSDKVRKKLLDAQKSTPVDFNYNIDITINRTQEPVEAVMAGAYIVDKDGKKSPVVMQALHWQKSNTMTFSISDVGKSQLFDKGVFELLMDNTRAARRLGIK
ncbi:DUF7424 family protein [Salmonella enterica]|uniref:DUF7424 domain-containing protein n=2 Tax=Salmonella enterica TaxID=28901 RepID=A0A379QNB5_SALER|nr:hypothetical protein [Salmonella enterica]ECC1479294.1 hypothetical protein [Salmonella enterica subsp. salamae]ASG88403.1 hypothetical protein LFZ47_12890 [Salmonella enterica subsp. salamae serovar 55:k:z39 str. 1315K]ECC1656479.1 hypothetical protein [Salmonella enterica subsp. salamae]ECD9413307.1 hypothetical protein [Salmonella enterica subsp. salamae]ECF5932492.1 hypothetical protein [Salmonella enterica subsp. salamae]